jgi:hypothetical protein
MQEKEIVTPKDTETPNSPNGFEASAPLPSARHASFHGHVEAPVSLPGDAYLIDCPSCYVAAFALSVSSTIAG